MADIKYAVIIGEEIVNMSLDRNMKINTSKLMKLLYFMQKLHSKKYGVPMFTDEIIATENGPYIQDVYEHFINGRLGFEHRFKEQIVLKDSHEDVSNTILDEYGNMSPSKLMKLSQEDELFKTIWDNGKGNNMIIPYISFVNNIDHKVRKLTRKDNNKK